MSLRTAIVLSKLLGPGAAANAAAIVCGQLGAMRREFFDDAPIVDASGCGHAAVRHNVVVLRANGSAQLESLVERSQQDPSLTTICFSRTGQELSDSFDAYRTALNGRSREETGLVAVLVFGLDADVRAATKKFSLFG